MGMGSCGVVAIGVVYRMILSFEIFGGVISCPPECCGRIVGFMSIVGFWVWLRGAGGASLLVWGSGGLVVLLRRGGGWLRRFFLCLT